ncbi:amidase [Amycolatopsis xylanica]|uniref:Amidase n=1 Tax=Amycolatopsis xylanica TaxID=589385 RepID=A0A1H3D2F9_9PSEU|nr:amidase [Amycolatopsis xylanica]SDX60653.1 amidase [Amycolatopsis xylanica]
MADRVHAFTDDALADHDAVGLASLVRRGEVSPAELAQAAIARAERVTSLNAVVHSVYESPRHGQDPEAALFGVPTFVKDNTDLRGMPTNHGTEAYVAAPAKADGRYASQFVSTGLTVLGKSRMPEYGFNATTEYMNADPVRNPWNPEYSVGASSGGSAALVAAGVVPLAHANDGGGSIRIPAACAGLIGLKPSRGRHLDGEEAARLPIKIISEGVVTRSVRDTAAFIAAQEDHWRNPALPPIGLVHGPARRRLRIGLITESVTGAVLDAPTRAAVERTATLLEKQGHVVTPVTLPVDETFASDFTLYWGMLATLAAGTGKLLVDRRYDRTKLDGLTLGLRAHYLRNLRHTPAALRRLSRVKHAHAKLFQRHELLLSPVLAHSVPKLGHISPAVPFDTLIERLLHYVAFTPMDNVSGNPAISLPMGQTDDGLPVGVQLSAAHGDERSLIETAFELEQQQAWRRIQD